MNWYHSPGIVPINPPPHTKSWWVQALDGWGRHGVGWAGGSQHGEASVLRTQTLSFVAVIGQGSQTLSWKAGSEASLEEPSGVN